MSRSQYVDVHDFQYLSFVNIHEVNKPVARCFVSIFSGLSACKLRPAAPGICCESNNAIAVQLMLSQYDQVLQHL